MDGSVAPGRALVVRVGTLIFSGAYPPEWDTWLEESPRPVGELGVPAFRCPESTARDIARQARRERGLSEPPTLERVASLVDRALTLAESELDRVESVKEVAAKDHTEVRESLRVVNEAVRLSATRQAASRPQPKAEASAEAESPLVQQMLADIREREASAHRAERLERTLSARGAGPVANCSGQQGPPTRRV
jgi:hypothetical protein